MIKSEKVSTRQLAIAGMLSAFSFMLSVTPLGYIPILFFANVSATTMHIPVIIGAILVGPLTGFFVGGIFGITSFLRATPAFFADPLVSIVPRLFIGITTYFTYKITKNPVIAAITGTATNTVGVLSMVYVRGYLPWSVVISIATFNGISEIIISSIIVYAVVKVIKNDSK